MEKQTVHVQSAMWSKINWTQLVAVAAMLLTYFGIELDAETQNQILALIIAGQGLATWFFKTFMTTTVTPASAAKLTDSGAVKK